MNVDDVSIRQAIDRIARTSDGLALYLYLQKTLCGVLVDTSGDALPAHNGRRMFASELMAQMRQGVQETHAGRDPAEQPFIFTVREPARVGGAIGSRAFASAVEPIPGPGSSGSGTKPAA